MFISPTALGFVITLALVWTGLGALTLVVLLVVDFVRGELW